MLPLVSRYFSFFSFWVPAFLADTVQTIIAHFVALFAWLVPYLLCSLWILLWRRNYDFPCGLSVMGFSPWTFKLMGEVNIQKLWDGRISDLCCIAGDETVLDLYSALTAQTVGLWLGPQGAVSLKESLFSGQAEHWVQVYLGKCPNLSGPFCLSAQCHWLSYWHRIYMAPCSCGKS